MLKSRGEKIFSVINTMLMVMLSLVFVLPYMMILSTSLTAEIYLSAHGPTLFPVQFSFASYKFIFTAQKLFVHSILNSVYLTVVGTLLGVTVCTLLAFSLSRKGLVGKKQITFYVVFTMLFSGGIIPYYLVVSGLGLLNSLWSIILPGAVNAWNTILIRNYFSTIPDSLEESAKLDGATNFKVMTSIIVPLSKPVIATVTLFFGVGFWNNWFGPMLFIDSGHRHLYPIQYLLREMLQSLNAVVGDLGGGSATNLPSEGIKNASIIIATLPIIMVYPFLQKYFIKGVILGSVKE